MLTSLACIGEFDKQSPMVARDGDREWLCACTALLRASLPPFGGFVSRGSALAAATADETNVFEVLSTDAERFRARRRSFCERREDSEASIIASPELARHVAIWLGKADSERTPVVILSGEAT